MHDYDIIIEKISKDLNIYRYSDETEGMWIARIVYSVMGKMALASLFDSTEEDDSISIQHLKNRMIRIFKPYDDLFPDLRDYFVASENEFTDEIYKIYSEAGYIYHEPNRILPSIKRDTSYKTIRFERGYPVGAGNFMSGLGTYSVIKDGSSDIEPVLEMFKIPNIEMSEIIKNIDEKAIWDRKHFDEVHIEYLRLKPPFSRGYWNDKPNSDGREGLMRVGKSGGWIYYLYKHEKGGLLTSEIPSWLVDKGEYRNISNSILLKYGELPAVNIKKIDNSVYIKQEYLLPPALLNFLRLYSWPCNFLKLPNDFERVMNIDMFEVFLEILKHIGIEVKIYV